jgi:FtsP/CotA-like multicopper oxidase with cupredoxin domain
MKIILQLFLALLLSTFLSAKQVEYNLKITEIKEIINGKDMISYRINNSSPGPVIRANIGDKLKIILENKTNIDTIIHWHGLMVNNDQDGVAWVTQPIIKSKTSHTYEIEVKQTGTYWYHAHGLEEAQGIVGAIVFAENEEKPNIQEEVLVYSGILKEEPKTVLAELTKSNIQDINSHVHGQKQDVVHKPMNMSSNVKHMNHGEMKHFSDVDYAKHLINNQASVLNIKNNSNQIKFRIINAYVDGYLNFIYSGGDITIVAADGLPVEPVNVNTLKVAMGETYDVILNIPSKGSYELVSFFMGGIEYSKVLLGGGELKSLPSYDVTKYEYVSPYKKLITITPSFVGITKSKASQYYKLGLKGNHDRYDWKIVENSKQVESLSLKEGDKVRVKITNHTMMPHPMHLHGFFFKVVSLKNNLIKHTYNLEHMESMEIEFTVDKEGKWLFHCHNLFHMSSGMMIELVVIK